MDLKVCFISTEFFDWGKYGGIGKATRLICTELAKRGVKVSVVVPRGKNQKPIEYLNNVIVYSYRINEYPFTSNIYKKINADIYHSEEPSWGTLIAQKNLTKSIHIATSQNPRDKLDWKKTIKYYKFRRRLYNLFIEKWINQNIFKLHKIFCQANYIIPKTRKLYKLNYDPSFLPNPITVPLQPPKKSDKPTVCFLGRFDREKNPEKFFELAKEFPEIEFIGMGQAHNFKLDKYYREKFADYKNLLLPGLVVGKNKSNILDKSWILINTSEFECLPISFLEAAAHGCAILSPHNPDNFSKHFGYRVVHNDYIVGLKQLLKNDFWITQSQKGYNYVSKIHEKNKVIDIHLKEYYSVLNNST